MKYVDSEKVIALIDAKLEDLGMSGSVWVGRSILQELKNDIITSLKQEQSDVDLKKEIDEYFKGWSDYQGIDSSVCNSFGECVTIDDIKEIAKHFFELGLRVNNENEK